MKKVNKILEKVIKPPRSNFPNIKSLYKKDLQNFNEKNFFIYTYDHIKLPCVFYENKKKDKETKNLIYNHSYASNKYEGLYLLKICEKNNLNLILYDSRASGKSGQSYIYFGFREKIDLLFLIMKLICLEKINLFILWGRSIGCNTVLQFYDTMLKNEGLFLNKKKKNNFKFGFNKFVEEYIGDFRIENDEKFLEEFNIKLFGIILDAPYSSLTGFVKDNVKKFSKVGSYFLLPIKLYLNYFLNTKLHINIKEDQNKNLVKRININTIFLFSDNDELIPKRKFKKLSDNFAKKLKIKNNYIIVNHLKTHSSKRDEKVLQKCIDELINNINEKNIYFFQIKSKNEKIQNNITFVSFDKLDDENKNIEFFDFEENDEDVDLEGLTKNSSIDTRHSCRELNISKNSTNGDISYKSLDYIKK